jgi:hypothetical protein
MTAMRVCLLFHLEQVALRGRDRISLSSLLRRQVRTITIGRTPAAEGHKQTCRFRDGCYVPHQPDVALSQ